MVEYVSMETVMGVIRRYLASLAAPHNVWVSFPIPGMVNGRLTDTFFTFDQLADAQGRFIYANELYFCDSGSGVIRGRFAVGRRFPMREPEAVNRGLSDGDLRRLEELYPLVRQSAYEPAPGEDALAALRAYRALLERVIPADLRQVYLALMPVFFQWLETVS